MAIKSVNNDAHNVKKKNFRMAVTGGVLASASYVANLPKNVRAAMGGHNYYVNKNYIKALVDVDLFSKAKTVATGKKGLNVLSKQEILKRAETALKDQSPILNNSRLKMQEASKYANRFKEVTEEYMQDAIKVAKESCKEWFSLKDAAASAKKTTGLIFVGATAAFAAVGLITDKIVKARNAKVQEK